MNRALVIGVKRLKSEEEAPNSSPSPAFLAGKALNALLLDPIEENIRRIDALNELMRWGQSAYPDFMERLRGEFKPYQIVEHVFLRPSEDLGRMAADIFARTRDDLPWAVSRLLGSLSGGADQKEADLMSYLFFDHRFTGAVESLGYEDAAREDEKLASLFTRVPLGATG